MRTRASWLAFVVLLGAVAFVVFRGTIGRPPPSPTVDAPLDPNSCWPTDETAFSRPEPRPPHPLLNRADQLVLAAGNAAVRSDVGADLAGVVRAVIESAGRAAELPSLTVDYPLDETIFPPEIVPPTFLWHEPAAEADTWLIDVTLRDGMAPIRVLSRGAPPAAGEIDPRCVAENNEIYQPTAYQASAKSWTPGDQVWGAIRRGSVDAPARITIVGFRSSQPEEALSRGRVAITTSRDPVGAPIFYRDVPLAPQFTKRGVIAPLGDEAVALIGWRLRDVSKPESRLLLRDVPTCTNCHSFSADGGTLGMDLDGPQGDKGAYVIAPITRQMKIEREDVISWNSFEDKPEGHKTIGLLSRLSPDGQFAVTTLNEAVYVCNFMDYRFLQVFFPTRGILGYYSRATGRIRALPGADDPRYVHCDAVWTPDGKHLIFARAEAKDPYPEHGRLPERANSPDETQIQYDLYRIPFDGGRGGKPEPIAGASGNGMSNTFPKVSPDGKWIVFVQCRNGQLMRPDSTLWIVPAQGGTARKMRCNTPRMNSWHSFSPNGRWMVFSSKANTPYTQMFLTHLDEQGNDSPAVLVPNSTAANRAVNLPEFVNRPYEDLLSIRVEALKYLQHGWQGIQLGRQGKLDEAMAEFETAIELQPDYWQAHVNVAAVLIKQGKRDEAMARLDKMLEACPEPGPALDMAGVILARHGLLDEAIDHFSATIERYPDFFLAHANLGRIFLAKGMPEKATAYFRRRVELDPPNPLGYLELGNALYLRGMFDEACAQFRKSLEIAPRLFDAHLMLGKTLAAQGDFSSAVARFREATTIDPNNLWAIDEWAWLLAACPRDDVRDGGRAVELAERVCAVSGRKNPTFLSTLAAAYAEVGEFSRAIATASEALVLVRDADGPLSRDIREDLEDYLAGKPCRRLRNESAGRSGGR